MTKYIHFEYLSNEAERARARWDGRDSRYNKSETVVCTIIMPCGLPKGIARQLWDHFMKIKHDSTANLWHELCTYGGLHYIISLLLFASSHASLCDWSVGGWRSCGCRYARSEIARYFSSKGINFRILHNTWEEVVGSTCFFFYLHITDDSHSVKDYKIVIERHVSTNSLRLCGFFRDMPLGEKCTFVI